MVRKLFLTPPTLPGTTEKRCIEIPSSREWLGIFNNALLMLSQSYNYEQVHDTDLTPEETAAICMQIYVDYLAGMCGVEDVRQNIPDFCTLEKTFNGVDWIPFANILACAATAGAAASTFTTGDLRIDPGDPDNPQWSPDGGTTWVDIPPGGASGPIVPPPGPTPGTLPEDKTCLAARRAAVSLAEFYKATYGTYTAGALNVLKDVNSFLFNINRALFQLVYSPYEGVLEAALFGDQDFSHYDVPELDAGVVDALTCILQENATALDSGVVTFDFTGVQTQIAAEISVNPALALQSLLTYIQSPGLDAAGGVQNTSSYDCTSCLTWEHCWDFTTVNPTGVVDVVVGTWSMGNGVALVSPPPQRIAAITIGAGAAADWELTSVYVEVGTVSVNLPVLNVQADTFGDIFYGAMTGSSNPRIFSDTGSWMVDAANGLKLDAEGWGGNPTYFRKVRIAGVGLDPFPGEPGC